MLAGTRILWLITAHLSLTVAQSDCIQELNACADVYGKSIGEYVALGAFYECVIEIDSCSTDEDTKYRQPVLDAIYETIKKTEAVRGGNSTILVSTQRPYIPAGAAMVSQQVIKALVLLVLCVIMMALGTQDIQRKKHHA